MPNKKKNSKYTGFYWFMQEKIPYFRQQGKQIGGINTVVPLARPMWKELTKQEQDRYEKIAKEMKVRDGKSTFGLPTYRDDAERLDNVGNIIANRMRTVSSAADQRAKDRKWASSRWPMDIEDMLDVKFYFIGCEYLCKITVDEDQHEYIPCEIALCEWSMRRGISKTFLKYIDADEIPLGYRFSCQQHSDESHQIPIEGFELADNNYRGIWMEMCNFVNPNREAKDTPPLYCMSKEVDATISMVNWLYRNAGIRQENLLDKVFVLEDCLQDLAAKVGVNISAGSAEDALNSTVFDYEKNTRCNYHTECDVRKCAMLTVKRFGFILSDFLSTDDKYNFHITENHLPIKDPKHEANVVVHANHFSAEPARPIESRATGKTTFLEKYNRQAETSALGYSNPENKDFGGRDNRYFREVKEPSCYSSDEEDSESTYSYSTRLSSASTEMSKPAFMSAPSNNPFYKPDCNDLDEFPSLSLAGSSRSSVVSMPQSSYAGRGASRIPANVISETSVESKATEWHPSPAYLASKLEIEKKKSTVPNLMDIVKQREEEESSQAGDFESRSSSLVGAGRGYGRGRGSSGNNTWMPTPGSNTTSAARVSAGRGAWSAKPQGPSPPSPNKWSTGTQSGFDSGDSNIQTPKDWSDVPQLLGVGRGRSRQTSKVETTTVRRPPPGFGRGYTNPSTS